MPAVPKKPLSALQRPSRASTRATLHAPVEVIETPPLPEGEWHAMAVAFWDDLWTSPMAPEYVHMDRHRLYQLVKLVDQFWRKPTVAVAAEIRQVSQGFGLSPLDRRRLQWEVERGEEAEQKRAARKPPAQPSGDPRATLRALG